MRTSQLKIALARSLAILAVVVLASTITSAQSEEAVNKLTQELSLTSEQVQLVRTTLAAGPLPVTLWNLSAELEPSLSDAQKATLFERRERTDRRARSERPERAEGTERAERPERAEGTERPARTERPERAEGTERAEPRERSERQERAGRTGGDGEVRAAEREARNRALGLSEAQGNQLDEILARRGTRGQQSTNQPSLTSSEVRERNEIPGEISTFLNADQQEIYRLHHALRTNLMSGRSR